MNIKKPFHKHKWWHWMENANYRFCRCGRWEYWEGTEDGVAEWVECEKQIKGDWSWN